MWLYFRAWFFFGCNGGLSDFGEIIVQIGTQIIDDADYTLIPGSVVLSGPGKIPKNAEREYTVTFDFKVHTAGGMVSPFVLLADWDDVLRGDNDLLVLDQHSETSPGPGTYSRSTKLKLKCGGADGDTVEGVAPTYGKADSSGVGYFILLQVDEAEVFARVQRGKSQPTQVVDSNTMDVWCE